MIKKLNALVPITGSEHWIGGLKKLDARSFAAIRVHVRIKLIKAGTVSHLRRRCSRRLVIRGHALLWIQINRKLKRKVRSRGRGPGIAGRNGIDPSMLRSHGFIVTSYKPRAWREFKRG